jgi:hypothetical protein
MPGQLTVFQAKGAQRAANSPLIAIGRHLLAKKRSALLT